MDVQVLLMLMIGSAAAASQHWFVVSPNMIRFGHEENVSVNVFGANNQKVEVWLEFNNKEFSKKEVVVASEETPQTVAIKVEETDIFDENTLSKPQFVTLKSRCNNVEKQAELKVNYQNGYLILQTDKPLYKPGEIVNYRLLALDEDLKHAKDRPLTIDMIDPKNRTVSRTKLTEKKKIYSDSFTIPKYSDLRLWTIRAYYMGQYSTEARVTFQVQEYELPTFGVDVTVLEKNCLLPSTNDFKVDVEAKYVYGEPVTGTASLELFLCNDKLGSREYVMSMQHRSLENGKHEFTIPMEDIRNSDAVTEDKQYDDQNPEGYYLAIDAFVFEYVTGNEEKGSGSIIFAATPYKFEFTQSRPSFRPGLVYTLQVQVIHANGKAVENGFANVKMTNTGANKVEEEVKQIENGRVISSFQTSQQAGISPLKFQVEVDGDKSEEFIVNPYRGDDQVQIEMVIAKGKPQLRIFGNAQGAARYTGLMMMIIARGNIVWSKSYPVSQEIQEHLDDNLMKKLSPSGRAVVFYVNKNNGAVISDSVQFQIKPTCQGGGLTLTAEKEVYRPGSIGKLTLQGEPLMLVGLNAMDKALLLLNKDNILKTNTMFRLLDQHDVGCGAGGGSSSSEVFRLAGVTVLTDADIVNVRRESLSCDENRRKKRNAEGCPVKEERCCTEGIQYAQKLLKEKRELERFGLDTDKDLKSKCYSYVLRLLEQNNHPTVCLNQWIKHCLMTVDADEEDDEDMSGKSFEDESDYERDIREVNQGEDIKVRTALKESWLFEEVTLNGDGKAEKDLLVPESITTHMIQGVGISDTEGVCIAEPVFVKSFRDFFIQLDIPYSAVRLENVPIKASIFNYYDGELTVRAYIEGVDGLCSSASVGKASAKQEAVIPGNSAASFDFLVLPLRAGSFEITVSAFAIAEGVFQSDGVMKKLLVLNEGKEHTKTIHVCLDPLDQSKDCENDEEVYKVDRIRGEETLKISLAVPPEAVPNTGRAVAYIKSSIMTDVVEKVISGTESLMRMPTGCGEQTVIYLAPCVYSMAYLKQTKQVTSAIETKGYDYIRKGVARELTYRHPDNSYAAWQSRPASTWLSAFVTKVFCQAKKVDDIAVNSGLHIVPTLEYLLTQHRNGEFFDAMPVIHREMVGQTIESDPSLTAFVITSFLECDGRTAEMNHTVVQAVKYLEGLPTATYENNPYLLAVTTYALAMADSGKKWDFVKLLKAKANHDGEKMYWGNPGGKPASAEAVETTSYALLAYLSFNYVEDCAYIVRWLNQQREGQGTFRTTMDTVIGLQALSEYSIRINVKDVNLQVTFLDSGKLAKNEKKFNVTNENAQVVRVVEGLHNGNGVTDLTLRVQGTGGALLSIDMSYNIIDKDEQCPFNVSDIEITDLDQVPQIDHVLAAEKRCDVCGICRDDNVEIGDEEDYPNFAVEVKPKAFGGKGLERRRRANRQIRSTSKKHCVRFYISSEKKTDMAIVRFDLQTGVTIIKSDLDKLQKNQPAIDRYELPEENRGYIIFYLNSIGPVPTEFVFRLSDSTHADKSTRQMAKVDVYEYYKTEQICTKYYDIGARAGKPVDYECNIKTNRNCVCLQNICAKDFAQKYTNMVKRGQKPVLSMKYRLCETDNADYAVLVSFEEPPEFKADTQYMLVTGIVRKVIHEGPDKLRAGSEMSFRYKATCLHPVINTNGAYYVIGKTGYKTPETNSYHYELMDPAIVIKKTNRRPLKAVMNAFERIMKNGCDS